MGVPTCGRSGEEKRPLEDIAEILRGMKPVSGWTKPEQSESSSSRFMTLKNFESPRRDSGPRFGSDRRNGRQEREGSRYGEKQFSRSYGTPDRERSSRYGQKEFSRYGGPDLKVATSHGGHQPVEQEPKEFKRLNFVNDSTLTDKEAKEWRSKHAMKVDGTAACPKPFLTFDSLPFDDRLKDSLKKNFSEPLAIQAQGWSVALSGVNMIGCADTGSGKTLAFVLPALETIKLNQSRRPTVLVLAPSRELAQQIEQQFAEYAPFYGVKTACLFGGAGNRGSQMRQVARSPQVIVACPGRLLDFCNSGLISLSNIRFLVLDEADRMLEMGFEEDLRAILDLCPPEAERQNTMWTATWPKEVRALVADTFKCDFVKVNVGSDELSANKNVQQKVLVLSAEQKLQTLFSLIQQHSEDKMIIFTNTKAASEFLEISIQQNLSIRHVTSIHGDKTQQQRNAILEDFKSGVLKIVIATDLASRGIDVKDIGVVVNYEMPQAIESYIHRIGRTARAGRKGTAYTLFTQNDPHASGLAQVIQEAGQQAPPELLRLTTKFSSKGRSSFRSKESDSGNRRRNSNPYGSPKNSSSQQNRKGLSSGSKKNDDIDWSKW